MLALHKEASQKTPKNLIDSQQTVM